MDASSRLRPTLAKIRGAPPFCQGHLGVVGLDSSAGTGWMAPRNIRELHSSETSETVDRAPILDGKVITAHVGVSKSHPAAGLRSNATMQ